ncbi:MAG: AI-2E family transporter [Rhodospirillales bacterium]|nr:AI-2E family transporter [Rhodospirillales bacterium]
MPKTNTISLKTHIRFWLAAFAAFLLFVWLFKGVLLPFVLGVAIAYLLDPLVERLARWKITRDMAALIILGLFIVIVVGLFGAMIPLAYREITQLADSAPALLDRLWTAMAPYTLWVQEKLGNGNFAGYQQTIEQNIGKILQGSLGVLQGGGSILASGGQAIAGFLSLVIFTPIVAFFMLKEWDNMTKWVDNLIPRGSYDTIKGLLGEINGKLSGFIRGQLTVAFALAVIYALALTVAGLDFGFLIGISAGILSIIPLVGSTVGLFVAVTVAWFQSYEWTYVALIAAIFLIGQFVEGNILTPKLLGKSVGLHPLWILFALLAGGTLFGIVGMLLAVPVAAVIGVLLAFAIKQYKASPFYEEKKAAPKPKKKTDAKAK